MPGPHRLPINHVHNGLGAGVESWLHQMAVPVDGISFQRKQQEG